MSLLHATDPAQQLRIIAEGLEELRQLTRDRRLYAIPIFHRSAEARAFSEADWILREAMTKITIERSRYTAIVISDAGANRLPDA